MDDLGLFDCLINDDDLVSMDSALLEACNMDDALGQVSGSKNDGFEETELEEAGAEDGNVLHDEKPWTGDNGDLLGSLLAESDILNVSLDHEEPTSDTSSDSGCSLEQVIMSPPPPATDNGSLSPNANPGDDEELTAVQVITPTSTLPLVRKPEPIRLASQMDSNLHTGTTTIVLPISNTRGKHKVIVTPVQMTKRKRVLTSRRDSGVDDSSSGSGNEGSPKCPKYPALLLTEEEKRICEKEGIRLPSHYPLSREEDKNLKRIRRKIRNKVSAQDSRKRKKEYVDAMEERVKMCTQQNEELHKKIELLETQNKTLAGQLRRLHQILVNGGHKQTQKSTAMMVLLLSTALFLIPGFKEHSDSKCSLDVSQAIKMPPSPGQSRSLLQFTPIKQEYGMPTSMGTGDKCIISDAGDFDMIDDIKQSKFQAPDGSMGPVSDHDYFSSRGDRRSFLDAAPAKSGSAYIEEDVPPEGYGPGKRFVSVLEKRINVSTGPGNQGVRTVVLHVPTDMK